MSKENLEQFMNQIAESEELQAKIGEEIDAEALIALGAECGCEFTAEELQESAELSDAELGTVAGGVTPRQRGMTSGDGKKKVGTAKDTYRLCAPFFNFTYSEWDIRCYENLKENNEHDW